MEHPTQYGDPETTQPKHSLDAARVTYRLFWTTFNQKFDDILIAFSLCLWTKFTTQLAEVIFWILDKILCTEIKKQLS